MKKILVTGFSGFVGYHFIEYLFQNKVDCEVYGIDIQKPLFTMDKYKKYINLHFKCVNLLYIEELRKLFDEFLPDYILHLASFSSVSYSWKFPIKSFTNNTNIFLNLLTAVEERNKNCRILSVGSSEEYGNVAKENLPLRENQRLDPISPYAVARVSQEMLARVFADSYQMEIVLTRSFNHIGPRQDERFVVSSFIRKILDIKRTGQTEGTIEIGDSTIIRDFVDVRDVVRAYYMLLLDGKSGEVYNICSEKGWVLGDVITTIAEKAGITVHTHVNPEFIRPNENRTVVGSAEKIYKELNWKPIISFEDTIEDMIEYMSAEYR